MYTVYMRMVDAQSWSKIRGATWMFPWCGRMFVYSKDGLHQLLPEL